MLEAGLDYGLRCTLMGHRNPRPKYGDGGSLKYRRKHHHTVNKSYLYVYYPTDFEETRFLNLC